MSLVAFAMRVSAVRAFRAVIWPEFTVVDSPQRPLNLLSKGRPLIAVYTGQLNDAMDGRELYAGDPRVALTVQVYLPDEVTVTVAGQPLKLDTREEGAETVLDVIARRLLGAFLAQDEPWAVLWAQLVQKTGRLQNHSYLVESDDGRVSARELVLDCETLYEPIPGAPPEGVWADLIALMRTDASERSVAPLADWIAAEIAGPQALPQEERDRIDLGLSAYAASVASILPIVRGSEIGEVAVTVDGPDGDQVVVPGPLPNAPDRAPAPPVDGTLAFLPPDDGSAP